VNTVRNESSLSLFVAAYINYNSIYQSLEVFRLYLLNESIQNVRRSKIRVSGKSYSVGSSFMNSLKGKQVLSANA
jgi:hypothetical protein